MILDLDLPTYHHFLFYHEDRNPFDWQSWVGIGGVFTSPLPNKISAQFWLPDSILYVNAVTGQSKEWTTQWLQENEE